MAARSADFPHLTATGRNVQEVESKLSDAIEAHLQSLAIQSSPRERDGSSRIAPRL